MKPGLCCGCGNELLVTPCRRCGGLLCPACALRRCPGCLAGEEGEDGAEWFDAD